MCNDILKPEYKKIAELAKSVGRDDDFIKKITTYSKNLEARNLPILFSMKHFCLVAGFNYESIQILINNTQNFYHNKYLKKKRGGFRHIRIPVGLLTIVQKWIKEQILDKVEMNSCVTAYCKNRSIIDNASFHTNSKLLIKIDLKDFYNHIESKSVYKIFRRLGYGKSVSIFMSNICCVYDENLGKKILPQGACTSPGISNIACRNMDLRLCAFAQKNDFRYSRYSDDLTFSTATKGCKLSYTEISKIISENKFVINQQKTRFITNRSRLTVTGLNINNGVSIPKIYRKKIATHLYNCLRFGVKHQMEKAEINKINYREWLLGNIFYIMSIHPKQGKIFKEKFDLINWIY